MNTSKFNTKEKSSTKTPYQTKPQYSNAEKGAMHIITQAQRIKRINRTNGRSHQKTSLVKIQHFRAIEISKTADQQTIQTMKFVIICEINP